MNKLTEAQTRGLAYFRFLALPAEERRALRAARKAPRYPDPRVIEALLAKGEIVYSHHDHGPHFKLAEQS